MIADALDHWVRGESWVRPTLSDRRTAAALASLSVTDLAQVLAHARAVAELDALLAEDDA